MSRPVHSTVLAHPQQNEKFDLDKCGSFPALIVTSKAREGSLREIVSVTKDFFNTPLAKWDEADSDKPTLSSRASIFLRLHGLNEEVRSYNKEIDESLWITILHVVLAVLTLGLFYLKTAMKIEPLAPDAKKLLGVDKETKAKTLLQNQISFDDLWNFSPETQKEISKGLGYESTYALWGETIQSFSPTEKANPLVAEAFAQPLSNLVRNSVAGGNTVEILAKLPSSPAEAEKIQERITQARKDLWLVAILWKSSPALLQETIVKEWSVEQILSVFSVVGGGSERWNDLFQTSGSRGRFAACPQDKLKELMTNNRFELILGPNQKSSCFFDLLSKEHWETLDAETIECFAKMEGAIDFSYLTITKEEFLALPAVNAFMATLKAAGPSSTLWNLCSKGKVPELVTENRAPTPPRAPNEEEDDLLTRFASYEFDSRKVTEKTPLVVLPLFPQPEGIRIVTQLPSELLYYAYFSQVPLDGLIETQDLRQTSPFGNPTHRRDSVRAFGEPHVKNLRKQAIQNSSNPSSPRSGSSSSSKNDDE